VINGIITVRGATSPTGTAYASIYRSTVGVPAQGAHPALGDVEVAHAPFNSSDVVGGNYFNAPLHGFDIVPNTATIYYYYMVVFDGGAVVTIEGNTGYGRDPSGVNQTSFSVIPVGAAT
jgi:hypothetical protein